MRSQVDCWEAGELLCFDVPDDIRQTAMLNVFQFLEIASAEGDVAAIALDEHSQSRRLLPEDWAHLYLDPGIEQGQDVLRTKTGNPSDSFGPRYWAPRWSTRQLGAVRPTFHRWLSRVIYEQAPIDLSAATGQWLTDNSALHERDRAGAPPAKDRSTTAGAGDHQQPVSVEPPTSPAREKRKPGRRPSYAWAQIEPVARHCCNSMTQMGGYDSRPGATENTVISAIQKAIKQKGLDVPSRSRLQEKLLEWGL